MKIKFVPIIFILLYVFGSSCSQNLKRKEINNKINSCDLQFPNELIPNVKKEFLELESYFIRHGLLKNRSGESYLEVYRKIAESDSFNFQSDTSFTLIDSIDRNLTTPCIYKLFTNDQLAQVTEHHLEVANKITTGLEENKNLSSIAKRYIELLKPEDFELEYLKQAALFGFYKMSKPKTELMSMVPDYKVKKDINQVLKIELKQNDTLMVAGEEVKLDKVIVLVRDFITEDPINRAIEIYPSRAASYAMYLNLLDAVNIPINDLREEQARKTFKLNFTNLSIEQKDKIENKVPKNIIIKEVK